MKLTDFVYLPRADRRALWLLLLFLTMASIVFMWTMKCEETPQKAPVLAKKRAKKIGYAHSYANENLPKETEYVVGEPFSFDPNTATPEQLLALGLRAWQIKVLLHYREKGGFFSKPSDFARLYGLTQQQYKRLEPFIVIANDYKPSALLVKEEAKEVYKGASYSPKMKTGEHLSLNTADTTALKRVPGIGSYFAKEIVRYRKELGGFYTIDQLKEIQDFPLASLSFFRLEAANTEKIAINVLSLYQLKRHPYINFYQARAITDYRRLKGTIKSVQDLQQLKEFSPYDISRLTPYISFETKP